MRLLRRFPGSPQTLLWFWAGTAKETGRIRFRKVRFHSAATRARLSLSVKHQMVQNLEADILASLHLTRSRGSITQDNVQ